MEFRTTTDFFKMILSRKILNPSLRLFFFMAGILFAQSFFPANQAWAQQIELRVVDELAPAGGLAMIYIELTEPEPISGGRTRVRYSSKSSSTTSRSAFLQNGILGQVQKVDMLSSGQDVAGKVTIEEEEIYLQLVSAGATFGTDLDLPIFAFAFPVDPDATPGQSIPFEIVLSDSEFTLAGTAYTVGVKQGTFTVGGVSITEMIPYRGTVAPGGTIVFRGIGFQSDADVNIEGADVDEVTFINSGEIHVTLESGLEIRNTTRVRLRNPDKTEDVFYPIEDRPIPMEESSISFVKDRVSLIQGTSLDLDLLLDLQDDVTLSIRTSDSTVLHTPDRISLEVDDKTASFRVFGLREGSVFVTAETNGISAQIPVNVLPGTAQMIPVIQNNDSIGLGLAITNHGAHASEVRLRGFPSGSTTPILESSINLMPLSQESMFLNEYNSQFNGFHGWVEISTTSSEVDTLFINVPEQLVRFPGSVGIEKGSKDFIFAVSELIPAGEYQFTLINNNPSEAEVVVDWFSNNGETLQTKQIMIAPQSSRLESVADFLSVSSDQLANSYLRFNSTQPLGTYYQLSSLPFMFGQESVPIPTRSESVFVPQFASGGGWVSEVQLISASEQPTEAAIYFVSEDGSRKLILQRELVPNEMVTVRGDELIDSPLSSPNVGSLVIESSGVLAVSAVVARLTEKVATVLPVYNSVSTQAIFAQVASGRLGEQTLFTGIALQNPGSEDLVLNIQVHDRDGNLTGETEQLMAPGTRFARTLSELIPGFSPQIRGHIRLSSDRPFLAIEIFGDSDLSFLSNVPASVK